MTPIDIMAEHIHNVNPKDLAFDSPTLFYIYKTFESSYFLQLTLQKPQ
jgi:hypothetical protein